MACPRARNVFIYRSSSEGGGERELLAGLYQNGTITHGELLSMLEIFVVTSTPYTVRLSSPSTSPPPPPLSAAPSAVLQRGEYTLTPASPTSSVCLSTERFHRRALSQRATRPNIYEDEDEDEFRDKVRWRDRRCVFTGSLGEGAEVGDWLGFEAAYVVPLGLEEEEEEEVWADWNEGKEEEEEGGESVLRSPRNGLLMATHMYQLFLQYKVAVNPDNNFKITCFSPNSFGCDGRRLSPPPPPPASSRPHHNVPAVSPDLLRWHYRQAVLANVRGAGEVFFEHDYCAGTDIMRDLLRSGEAGRLQFEAEVRERLVDHAMAERGGE